MLEYLVARATGGTLDWQGVLERIESDGSREQLLRWNAPHLACAALLACVLDPSPRHFDAAATVLQALTGESKLWTQAAAHPLRLATQIAAITDSHALFQELAKLPFLPQGVAWAGETDFLRPQTPAEWGLHRSADGSEGIPDQFSLWWSAFNAPFTEHGLPPYELHPARLHDLEQVFAAIEAPEVALAEIPLDEQPLVTVIVPTYAPEASFLHTVSSLTRQSWSNVEVLIMDDCSPSGQEFLEAATASDPRVRVIRMEQNGGAYRARNAGLRAARGDFVTFQDADDLSHPKRIELQVLPLLDDPTRVASVSRAQRVLTDGRLTYFGYLPHRVNASSLLFRRVPVLNRLGRFDAVRKGADSEFAERLIGAFGTEAIIERPEPLSLVQLTLGSLSRSDFRPDWMSGNRLSYLRQFRAAHRRIAAQPEPQWDLSDTRPAISWSSPGMRGEPPRQHLATAVVSDWNSNLATLRDAASVIRDLAGDAPGPIGLLNGMRPRFSSMSRAAITAELTESVEQGLAAWMNWADATSVGTLVFDNPEFLWALPHPGELGVAAERVEIVLDEFLRRTDSPALPPIGWCEDRVRERFGVRPTWRVSSHSLLSHLRERGSTAELLDGAENTSATQATPPARPVIGVPLPARADRARWDLERVLEMLPQADVAETVFYDEAGLLDVPDVVDPALRQIRVLRQEDCDRAEFLRRVDVLLPDLFGQRLLAAESWIRRCRGTDVRLLLPHGLEIAQQARVLRYPPLASREILSAMVLDPSYATRVAEDSFPQQPSEPRVRFLIFGSDDPTLLKATEQSIRELRSAVGSDIRRLRGEHLGDVLSLGVLDGLSASDRVCLVPAGTRFVPTAFDAFDTGSREDLHVFTEAAYEYQLNGELNGLRTVVARSGAPLWTGATTNLVRADVLAAVARRHADCGIRTLAFAAAVSISGGYGVLGGVRSPETHEDRADEAPEALTIGWYTDFVREWAHLLQNSRDLGPAHEYLQEVFVHLMAVRLRLNSGPGQKLTLSDEAYSSYSRLLGRALGDVADARVWAPRPQSRISSPALRKHLLRLKHEQAFAPVQGADDDGPVTTFNGIELERPSSVRVTIDAMHVRNGTLTVRGRLPLIFDYPGYSFVLRTGKQVLPLPDLGRFADVLLHGRVLNRARTFDVDIPLSQLGDRLEFCYERERSSVPLRLYFARATAKLSYQRGAYWAIRGAVILTPAYRRIEVAPYSRRRLIAAELRRQRSLRSSGDPVQVSAARLRIKYFLTRRRFARKHIWMYADRIAKGGDNGEYAFAFAVDQNDGIEKHYVLGRGTSLEQQFTEKGLSYLPYGTDEQRLHYLNADVVFATRLSPTDTFGFQQDQKHFRDLFDARLVYINHGLVVDRLDYVLNAGYTDFDRVCVVSESERDNLLTPSYGYRPEQVEVTGFARYDGLRSNPQRMLLLAPTWRAYLHNPQQGDRQADEHRAFRRTAYFRVFESLIRNRRLSEALHQYGYRLLFLLHPNASSQLADFTSNDERISVRAATDDVSYEDLLTAADLMITDYSGVQFDFAHMRKPVVYYQPDSIPPHYREDSFDYTRDAFGEVATTEEELVAVLIEYLERDCAIAPRYEQRIERFFVQIDHENARRIYRVGRGVAPRPGEEPHRG